MLAEAGTWQAWTSLQQQSLLQLLLPLLLLLLLLPLLLPLHLATG